MIEPSALYRYVDLLPDRAVGQFTPLRKIPGVAHAVTTKSWGLFPKVAQDGEEQYGELAAELGLTAEAYVNQTHDMEIHVIDEPGFVGDADGLITATPGIGLVCRFADCVPIMLASPDGRAVAVGHASWRNGLRDITGRLVEKMCETYRLAAGELIACIGPSAGPESYIVGQEVYDTAVDTLGSGAMPFFLPNGEGQWLLDLWAMNVRHLMQAGVDFMNIYTARVDTMQTTDLYPSYRAEGDQAGRFCAMIGVAEK